MYECTTVAGAVFEGPGDDPILAPSEPPGDISIISGD